MRLKGKTALISGAGRNNGKAIAIAYAREGADLILVSRMRAEELKEVANECERHGARTLSLLADVAQHQEVERVVKQGLETFGKVDVMVSVVGMRPHKPFWEFSYEEWHNVFNVNLHSTYYFARALAPSMIERKSGSIIALGGRASLGPEPQGALVVASKHGLYGLIKSLALELGPHGIRANLIALSHIENKRMNPEWYAYAHGDPNAHMEEDSTPLRRTGKPDEVANVALFLGSDDSSYITGDRICCAGGRQL